jgi:hypothetical protein
MMSASGQFWVRITFDTLGHSARSWSNLETIAACPWLTIETVMLCWRASVTIEHSVDAVLAHILVQPFES